MTFYDPDGHYTPSAAFTGALDLITNVSVQMAANNGALGTAGVNALASMFADTNGASLRGPINALRNMADSPDYLAARKQYLDRILGEVFHWLPESGADHQLPDWTRHYLSNHMSTSMAGPTGVSDFVALGLFAGNQSKLNADRTISDQFYWKLEFLGEPAYVKGLQDFVDFLAQGIQGL